MTDDPGGDTVGIAAEAVPLTLAFCAQTGITADALVVVASLLVQAHMGWGDEQRRAWLHQVADGSGCEAEIMEELKSYIREMRARARGPLQ